MDSPSSLGGADPQSLVDLVGAQQAAYGVITLGAHPGHALDNGAARDAEPPVVRRWIRRRVDQGVESELVAVGEGGGARVESWVTTRLRRWELLAALTLVEDHRHRTWHSEAERDRGGELPLGVGHRGVAWLERDLRPLALPSARAETADAEGDGHLLEQVGLLALKRANQPQVLGRHVQLVLLLQAAANLAVGGHAGVCAEPGRNLGAVRAVGATVGLPQLGVEGEVVEQVEDPRLTARALHGEARGGFGESRRGLCLEQPLERLGHARREPLPVIALVRTEADGRWNGGGRRGSSAQPLARRRVHGGGGAEDGGSGGASAHIEPEGRIVRGAVRATEHIASLLWVDHAQSLEASTLRVDLGLTGQVVFTVGVSAVHAPEEEPPRRRCLAAARQAGVMRA